jgi:hypothetical protein
MFRLYINASDNDLLIHDKSVYNESLNFTSNTTLFNITKVNDSNNWSIGLINFTPSNSDIGNYTIKINVTDRTGNSDYKIFALTIWNNSGPVWDDDTPTNQTVTEHSAFFLNLSQYVHDPDNDSITFSSNVSSEFPSFNLTSGGIINFTANDNDVGAHAILITATDNRSTYSTKLFNFTVNNVNDLPNISQISNISIFQDNETIFYIYAYDNDLVIDDNIYNETLSFNKTITNLTGSYRDLFNITVLNTSNNLTTAMVNFTPGRLDVGNYTINISVKDYANASAYAIFNINIFEINHAPRMSTEDYVAGVNSSFVQYIIATDVDNDSITFTDNTTLFNIALVNQTYLDYTTTSYAIINFTPNDSAVGIYVVQVNATDQHGLVNSSVFTIKIYGEPSISYFSCSKGVSGTPLYENSSSLCTIDASQAVEESMDYEWLLDNVSVQNDSGNGLKTWIYETNFSDEGEHNLTVFISNDYFTADNNLTVVVNHTNAPPEFSETIHNINSSGSLTSINLLDYFSDLDNNDTRYNQSINFTWAEYDSNLSNLNSSSINISLENYTLNFRTSENVSEYIKITAVDSNDSNLTVESNYFLISFTIQPETTPTVSPSSGGSSSTKEKIVSINLLIPGPVTMYSVDNIIVPIKLLNDGDVILNNISLKATTSRENVILELNKTTFEKLEANQSEEVQLIIKTEAVEVRDLESFEIDISAEVYTPEVNDSAKILVNMLETNRALRIKAEEKNNFLSEFVASNPECLELKEILNQAEEAFKNADYNQSLRLSEKAIQACKSLLKATEFSNLIPKIGSDKIIYLTLIVLLVIIALLAAFSLYYNKKRSNT